MYLGASRRLEKELGPEDPFLADTLRNIGLVLSEFSCDDDAVEAKTSQNGLDAGLTMPDQHDKTNSDQTITWYATGQHGAALRMLERALHIYVSAFGTDSANAATTRRYIDRLRRRTPQQLGEQACDGVGDED